MGIRHPLFTSCPACSCVGLPVKFSPLSSRLRSSGEMQDWIILIASKAPANGKSVWCEGFDPCLTSLGGGWLSPQPPSISCAFLPERHLWMGVVLGHKDHLSPPSHLPSPAFLGFEAPKILKKKCQNGFPEIVVYVKFLCLIS